MTAPHRFPGDPLIETIDVGRQFVQSNLRYNSPGSICPCCTQQAVLRKRRLAATSVRVLLEMYLYQQNRDADIWADYHRQHAADEWMHLPDFLALHPDAEFRACIKSREHSRLKYWLLLEPQLPNSGSRKAGVYRLTPRGVSFAAGRVRVPRWVWIFDDIPRLFSSNRGPFVDMVTVQEALGNNFNYEEIVTPEYIHTTPAQDAALGRARMRRLRRRRQP